MYSLHRPPCNEILGKGLAGRGVTSLAVAWVAKIDCVLQHASTCIQHPIALEVNIRVVNSLRHARAIHVILLFFSIPL